MKKRWWRSGIIQFLLGAGTIYGFAVLLKVATRASVKTLPGWTIVRPPEDVFALAIQGDTVWAGGKDGLVAIDRRNAQLRPLPANAPKMQYIKSLLVDRKGNLWVGHGGGLMSFGGGQWQGYPELAKLLPTGVLSLTEDREGVIWIGGENGVVQFLGGEFRTFRLSVPLASVDAVFQDASGAIWFGSASPAKGGLLHYQNGQWNSYDTRSGLAHNSVNGIIQDRSGALWFALGFATHGGAARLFHGTWTTLNYPGGLGGDKVRSVYEDRNGNLWFGSEYFGVAVQSGGQWRVITPNEGFAGWEARVTVQDPEGVYWFGTENGISRVESLDWDKMSKRR
jgi:ligand-binding sensor domain-containing protein